MKTKATLEAELTAALKLIKSMEWSGSTSGPPTGMGMNNGPDVQCCPWCFGIKPTDPYVNCYIASAIGHTKKCKLNLALS